MNYLNTFTYLEDMSLPEDPLWQKSFRILQNRGLIPTLPGDETEFSVNYEPHWEVSEEVLSSKIYIPGFKGKTLGVRPPRNLMYLLCHPDTNLRGFKIVQCCATKNCINPAHMYVTTNKFRLYEQFYPFITEEEWEQIRGEILVLEVKREMSVQAVQEAVAQGKSIARAQQAFDYFNGTNDQILSRAIRRYAKNVPNLETAEALIPTLERLQILTVYREMSMDARDLVEQLILVEDSGYAKGERVTTALMFVANWYGEVKMKEALKCLNIL